VRLDDENVVTFEDVHVRRDAGLALVCGIGANEVWVPKAQLLPGTTVRSPGDRGRLIVPRWFALDQGLV